MSSRLTGARRTAAATVGFVDSRSATPGWVRCPRRRNAAHAQIRGAGDRPAAKYDGGLRRPAARGPDNLSVRHSLGHRCWRSAGLPAERGAKIRAALRGSAGGGIRGGVAGAISATALGEPARGAMAFLAAARGHGLTRGRRVAKVAVSYLCVLAAAAF